MSDYLLKQGTRVTPQSQAIPGTTQVPNSAGGFAWAVDHWTQLSRFLILGSEGGSYYASERELTTKNVTSVRACVAEDGLRTVNEIVAISGSGRAPKNEAALYALAVCISLGDRPTKRAAGIALPQVARIGTHLFHFVAYCETMRGWGRVLRKAVGEWYLSMPLEKLAYQLVKYRQRDGWSHRDLLRLSHPKPKTLDQAALFAWVTHGVFTVGIGTPDGEPAVKMPSIVEGFNSAQASVSPGMTAGYVRQYRLPREALLTEHLNEKAVWDAMLDVDMPIGAMVRNLATMTRLGILDPVSQGTARVVETLSNGDLIRKARIHPIALLSALLTYRSGHGVRGTNSWIPVARIVDVLDEAFYLSFGNVTPMGGRTLLALDISGSMGHGTVAGVPGLTPRMAASAMAMVTARAETLYEVVGFFSGNGGWSNGVDRYRGYGGVTPDGLTPLPMTPRERLDDIVRETAKLPMGGTDCALPMLYAEALGREFDRFIIYTDSETWAGTIHPAQALKRYRERFVPNARLVVVGMVSNGFSIADPNDAGMLDVVGFDTAAPEIIGSFARGEI
jgi:60 kDa SS-A/Ro ribonucleoprotein